MSDRIIAMPSTPLRAMLAISLAALAIAVGCDGGSDGGSSSSASEAASNRSAEASGDSASFDPTATVETVRELDPEQLLDEVVAAYRNAPAMTDQLVLTYRTRTARLQQPFEGTIRIGEGTNAYFATPRTTIFSVDGLVYLTITNAGDRYLQTELIDGDLKRTMRRSLRATGAMPHHFSIRASKPRAAIVRDISLEMLDAPSVSSAELLRNAYGEEAEVLHITSTEGSMDVYVDPETKLIIAADAVIPQPSDPTQEMFVNIRYGPRIVDRLPEPITFDTAGKTRVDSVQALAGLEEPSERATPGAAVPDFTIVDADGNAVTLSDLRGSYVVLDFWATWCKPCLDAFPKINEFAEWARDSEIPIKVYGVNVMESAATEADRRKKADAFWDMQQLGFPTLVDTKGDVEQSYRIISIPTTLVIGPDGSLVQRFTGSHDQLGEMLRQVVSESWSRRSNES